jgi:hypothetical protein
MKKKVKKDKELPVSVDRIEKSIFVIRGQKVMLDRDLAELYGVPTKVLKQAVKRNIDRFPQDFMFVLTRQQVTDLRSQIVTSSSPKWGGARYEPMAFTEQGVAMLSSVLRTKRAVQVNIEIMRAFVRIREMIASHRDLKQKLSELEKKYDAQFRIVFEAIAELMTPSDDSPKRKIGFEVKEKKIAYGEKTKAKKNAAK